MLECNDFEVIYIGQTGRSFKIRYSEHMRSLRQLSNSLFDSTSSFADHLINDNHLPSPNNPQPLHFAPNGPKLDILGPAEIKKVIFNNEKIFNNQQAIKSSTIIYYFNRFKSQIIPFFNCSPFSTFIPYSIQKQKP